MMSSQVAATRLANAVCSDRQIMAITGHKTASEVSRYAKAAEQAKPAEQAMANLSERTKHHGQHPDPAGQNGLKEIDLKRSDVYVAILQGFRAEYRKAARLLK